MNNFKHLFFMAVLLLLVGCSKDVNVKLSESNHSFEAAGGTAEITLESNGSWQVNGCPEWFSVAPLSGDGNATLTLTCAGNTESQERSAEIKVKTKTNEATLIVKQAYEEGNFIVFTPDSIKSDFQGGSFSVRVDANCDWSIATLPSWIRCEPMSGSQSTNLVMNIERYSLSSETIREYDVDFVAGESHFYLHVEQDNDAAYHVTPTPRSLNFGVDGGTQTVDLQSICAWTLECAADWISVTPTSGDGNGQITVTVTANSNYSARNARIILTSSVGCTSSIMVSQEALVNPHYLEVNPSELLFPCEESSLEFDISTDSLWNVNNHDSWVTLSENTGTGDATITVTAAAYTLLGSRRAEIEVISGSIYRVVTITQESGATEPILSFNPDYLQLTSDHSFSSVAISANVGWTLQMSEDWVCPNIMQGIGDTNIEIETKDNISQEPRSAMIYLSYHSVVFDTLTIEQEGCVYHLETNVTELNASNDGDTFLVVVSANQSWEATSGVNWILFEPEHGEGDGEFRIIVKPNNAPAARTAEVRLVGGVTGVVYITVNQGY